MPKFSPERGVELLTVKEAAQVFEVHPITVKRALKKPGVYSERLKIATGKSVQGQGVLHVDPLTLAAQLKKPCPKVCCTAPERYSTKTPSKKAVHQPTRNDVQEDGNTPLSRSRQNGAVHQRLTSKNPQTPCINEKVKDSLLALFEPPADPKTTVPNLALFPKRELDKAQRLTLLLQPLAALPKSERAQAFRKLAAAEGVSVRTVRRWYDHYQQGREVKQQPRAGTLALLRPRRTDKGKPRIPEELFGLLVTLWLMHPNASAPKILRIIELNEPALLSYRKRKTHRLSESTVLRVKRWMKKIPELKVAMMNADERHEFGRVWAGEVMTQHANELWMADMTRCDSFVFDPHASEPDMYRLRVHAVIDVYSGAVPAFVFSRAEDQGATDRMLMLAVHEKPGIWAEHWPIYGRPETLYWDNGKVYRSAKSDRLCADLGIRIAHSRPYVSHSRGNIERLFGTFHQDFEKNLPGYAGEDAKGKSGKELERLWKNTLAWHRAGCPQEADPYPERLLTEDEYKQKALAWLVADYQTRTHLGKTRNEHYLETAPLASRAQIGFDELMLLFSNREVRTVEGSGFLRWRNRKWGLADAGLARYKKEKIVVLANELIPGNEQLKVGLENSDGSVTILGDLLPFGGPATSEENREHRRLAKGVLKATEASADVIHQQLFNPAWRHDAIYERRLGLAAEPLLIERAPSAKLAAVNPEDAYEKQLEEDRKALEKEGLKLDWDVSPRERGRDG